MRPIVCVIFSATFLVFCGQNDESTVEQQPSESLQIPVMPPPPDEMSATPQADSSPSGELTPDETLPNPATIICASGRSEDPPPNQINPPAPAKTAATKRLYLIRLQPLLTQFPHSATARVRAGSLVNDPPPQGNPAQAQQYFTEALRLHAGNCRLTEADEWTAQEGLALAYMYQSSYAAALPVYQQITKRWPTIPQSNYNLACIHCRLNQVDLCHDAFVKALQVAAAPSRPPFIQAGKNDVGNLITLSRTDSDLAPLRSDPRFQSTIASFSKSM